MIKQPEPGSKLVRFIHSAGAVHQVVTTEAKAKEIVRKWRMKECEFFFDEDGGTWAIRASAIVVIEFLDYAAAVSAMQKQPDGPRGPSLSFGSN